MTTGAVILKVPDTLQQEISWLNIHNAEIMSSSNWCNKSLKPLVRVISSNKKSSFFQLENVTDFFAFYQLLSDFFSLHCKVIMFCAAQHKETGGGGGGGRKCFFKEEEALSVITGRRKHCWGLAVVCFHWITANIEEVDFAFVRIIKAEHPVTLYLCQLEQPSSLVVHIRFVFPFSCDNLDYHGQFIEV